MSQLAKAKLQTIKEAVLGKRYNLSLVYASDFLMKKLNSRYRKKNKSTNVLSFPLDENNGEIFINKKYGKTEWGIFLFLHSLLHLKGFDHGKIMDKEEEKWAKKFKIKREE